MKSVAPMRAIGFDGVGTTLRLEERAVPRAVPGQLLLRVAACGICARLIGYRALRMCGYARRLGLFGFGAAAHILAQVARGQGRDVYAFTRPGDDAAQALARELGATWAGSSENAPPDELTRGSCSRPTARSCPPRCSRSHSAAPWCAAASI